MPPILGLCVTLGERHEVLRPHPRDVSIDYHTSPHSSYMLLGKAPRRKWGGSRCPPGRRANMIVLSRDSIEEHTGMTRNDFNHPRQLSVYELFVLKRAVHADLERRSRLGGSVSLLLPGAHQSRAACMRTRNSAVKRGRVQSPTLRDASAVAATPDSVYGRDLKKTRASTGRAGTTPARPFHQLPKRGVATPPAASPRPRR
jgi:hypothetical protein